MEDPLTAWESSGAMALTGRPDHPPLGPPAPLIPRLGEVSATLAALVGDEIPDLLSLLSERARILGLSRNGTTSCSGSTRLLESADGWVAVTLSRVDDLESVPAWLELEGPTTDPWDAVGTVVPERPAAWLVERASLLGLPVSALPPCPTPVPEPGAPFGSLPIRAERFGPPGRGPMSTARVLDMSSLWAGPLCGRLLAQAGCHVTKVESTSRPDAARTGSPELFRRLNSGKDLVAVDLDDDDGRRKLRDLVTGADVVIEASRPRALRHLGIHAEHLLASGDGPSAWVSITGYGRPGPPGMRVAFGDDAAVGGGLVVHDDEGPCFCADAVADPLTGIVAATAALLALESGDRWLLDVAMAGVAAHFAGPTLPT